MPKRPTPIANDRSLLRVWPFALLVLDGLLLVLWLSGGIQRVGLLLFAACVAGLCAFFLLQAARWKRIHTARKQAAGDGEEAGVPLASPHPVPNGEALPLPCQVTLQPRKGPLVAYTLLVGAGTFVVYSLVYSLTLEDRLDLLRDWPLHLILPLLLGGQFFWRFSKPQRIRIAADELLVQDPLYDWLGNNWQTGVHRIAWQEARLFAIRSGPLGTPATRYELSSPTSVVTFGRARSTRWWRLYRPVLAWENYAFQMDALLDLIAAKTGLPLYDVRQGAGSGLSSQPLLPREQSSR